MSELPTVVQALSAVMGEVQSVGKTERNTHQNYNFRGVDAVVNAVGPALRNHGVVVVPVSVDYEAEKYKTAKGSEMRGVTVKIGFRFYGPAGDHIDAVVAGESSDSGDKAVPKAHSVAYRTLLLQALCIPTDEPDPDMESHQRGSARVDDSIVTALEARLVALVPAVAANVIAHRAEHSFEGHKDWLERCIAKAEDPGPAPALITGTPVEPTADTDPGGSGASNFQAPDPKKPTPAKYTLLNILVDRVCVQAKRAEKPELWAFVGIEPDEPEDSLHFSALREKLTMHQASELIDHLVTLEEFAIADGALQPRKGRAAA